MTCHFAKKGRGHSALYNVSKMQDQLATGLHNDYKELVMKFRILEIGPILVGSTEMQRTGLNERIEGLPLFHISGSSKVMSCDEIFVERGWMGQ